MPDHDRAGRTPLHYATVDDPSPPDVELLRAARTNPEVAERSNVLDRQRWATRAELRLALVTWIERTYHRRRQQRTLGRLTPIEFDVLHTPVATAA